MSELDTRQLKQRIVGIIVLVLCAVIVLPVILDGDNGKSIQVRYEVPPPPEAESIPQIKDIQTNVPVIFDVNAKPENISTKLPSQRQEQPQSKNVVIVQKEKSVVAEDVKPESKAEDKETKQAASAKSEKKLQKPVQKAEAIKASNPSATKSKAPVKTVTKSSSKTEKKVAKKEKVQSKNEYLVKVGVFKNKKNVEKLVKDIMSAKINAYSEFDKKISAYHVYCGPFLDRSKANQIKSVVDKKFRIKSYVTKK